MRPLNLVLAGTLLTFAAGVCAPSIGRADCIVWPQNDWNFFVGNPCDDQVMTLWYIDVDDPEATGCGTCATSTTAESMTLAPGHLIVGVGGNLEGVETVEVHLIENDPQLSATVISFSGAEILTQSVSALGQSTLTLPSSTFGVEIDCCDCQVWSILWQGDRIVSTRASGWSALKSRY